MTTWQQLVSWGVSCALAFVGSATGMSRVYDHEYTGGGSAADLLDVNGALTLSGTMLSLTDPGVFNIGDALWITDGGVWLLDYNAAAPGLNGGGDLQTPGGGCGYITLTAVPEPAAALIGSLGLLALVRRRRG
jgi:hypothetical protein